MATVLGIVILAAVVGVVMLVQTGIGKSVNAVDRRVRSGTYQSGNRQVWTGLKITSPAPVRQTLEAVVTTVNAHASAPALVGGLFVKARGDDWVIFSVSNKLEEALNSVLQLQESASGCTGTFTVTAWKTSGADVAGRTELPRLRERIARAVSELGGTAEEVEERSS